MDPETAQGQSGAAGDPAVSREQSVPREDGPGDPGTERETGAGSAHPTPVRPYTLNIVQDLNDALAFSAWLAGHRDHGSILGISYRRHHVGLASQEEGWIFPIGGESISLVIRSALNASFGDASPLRLCCYNISASIIDFYQLDLRNKIVDDVETLSYCTGHTISGNYQNPADEAYDALLICGEWRKNLRGRTLQFYEQVALPALKHRGSKDGLAEKGVRWRITYEDLLLRVLASLSNEPVLVRAFLDERDPVEACRIRLGLLEEGDPENYNEQVEGLTYAVLLWGTLGFDAVWMAREYPDIYALLPSALNDMRRRIESQLPIIPLWVSRTLDDYTRQKGLQTRYGRNLRWGAHPSDALRFSLLGTAQDVLDVVLVSLVDNPEGAWVGQVEGSLLDRSITLSGSAGRTNKRTWFPILKYLATGGEPLSVPLAPAVVWG